MIPYPLPLALRYLRTRPIAWFATFVVAFGVTAVIVVLSILRGMVEQLEKKARNTYGDIVIESEIGYGMEAYDMHVENLLGMSEVSGAAPQIVAPVIVELPSHFRARQLYGMIRGVDPEAEATVTDLPGALGEERSRLGSGETSILYPGYLWQGQVWRYLDEQSVRVYTPTRTSPMLPIGGRMPTVGRGDFRIAGPYRSWDVFEDQYVLLTDLATVQRLLRRDAPPTVDRIKIRLHHAGDLGMMVDRLRRLLPPTQFRISTWRDEARQWAELQTQENVIMSIILSFIVLACGFGVLTVVVMMVKEKTRDIGILKALGAGTAGVAVTFVTCGAAIGTLGAGIGTALGIASARNIDAIAGWAEKAFGIPNYFADAYYFQNIPVTESMDWTVWVGIFAMTVSVVSSLVPALLAARKDPVETLRYE